jgi:glucokinase
MAAPDGVTTPTGFVADIGGTNARFALAWTDAAGRLVLGDKTTFATVDFPSFGQCAEHWLSTLPASHRPTAASLAFAGPVSGDHVALTNRAWSFTISALRDELHLDRLRVINDFAAIAHALPLLSPDGWHALPGPPWPTLLPRAVTVLGPGTGLGVSLLLTLGSDRVVLASEGGHSSFAPVDAVEMELLRRLTQRFGRVSCERFLSGPGLVHIHESLSDLHGWNAVRREPADIVAAATAGDDRLCVETVERFCLILATVAGDLALVQGADAVAIAGGIPPRMLPFLESHTVRDRFDAKGRARAVMQTLPVAVIIDPDPGLLGAAAVLLSA